MVLEGLRVIDLTRVLAGPFCTMMLAELNGEDLTLLAELMQSSQVTPAIDRSYGLKDLPAAIAYLEEGHARGKVVIDVKQQTPAT